MNIQNFKKFTTKEQMNYKILPKNIKHHLAAGWKYSVTYTVLPEQT